MRRHTCTEFRGRAERKKLFRVDQLSIAPRLILCFAFTILLMLGTDAVVLWQFDLVRAQTERLNGIDQKLVAVLRIYTSLLAFYDRLEALAESEDAARMVVEAGPLRTTVLEDTQRARASLSLLPSDLQQDPMIVETLLTIQIALPAQLQAITSLAAAGDWRGVRLRLANQVQPLESLTMKLVQKVDSEVGEEQAQTVQNVRSVQRQVLLIVPTTAMH